MFGFIIQINLYHSAGGFFLAEAALLIGHADHELLHAAEKRSGCYAAD